MMQISGRLSGAATVAVLPVGSTALAAPVVVDIDSVSSLTVVLDEHRTR